ncbi:MAG: hypothetical protein Q9160_009369 [Pyrenula sp. 1 TL-2023]
MSDSIKPLLKLSRENHRQWFPLIQAHLQSKDADWILNPLDNYPEGVTDAEKRKARGTAKLAIQLNTGWEDKALIAEEDNVRRQWEALRKKYKDSGVVASERAQEQFFGYRVNEDSIDHAWSTLNRLATQIRQSDNEAMRTYLTESRVFKQLLTSLPSSFSTIRDTIRTNPNQSVDVMLEMLYTKEREISHGKSTGIRRKGGDDVAYFTKGKQQSRRHLQSYRRRDSSSSSDSESRSKSGKHVRFEKTCILCDKSNHVVKDCFVLPEARTFAKGFLAGRANNVNTKTTSEYSGNRRRANTAYVADSDSEMDPVSDGDIEAAYIAAASYTGAPGESGCWSGSSTDDDDCDEEALIAGYYPDLDESRACNAKTRRIADARVLRGLPAIKDRVMEDVCKESVDEHALIAIANQKQRFGSVN